MTNTNTNTSKLSKDYNININKESFDEIFFDEFNNHGYQSTGVRFDEVKDSDDVDRHNLNKVLPEELSIIYENSEVMLLVKESNIYQHMLSYVIGNDDEYMFDEESYDKMLNTIKKELPDEIIPLYQTSFSTPEEYGEYAYNDTLRNGEFKNKLSKFAANLIIKNAKLKINDEKIYVSTLDELKINFAKLYFESDEYKNTLNK